MAANFDDALANVESYALTQFTAAYNQVSDATTNPADRAKAEARLAAALAQLGQVEVMRSEKRGRVGYDAVVSLMVGTQVAAADAFGKLQGLTAIPGPLDADKDRIVLLTNLLLALARLSPVPIWQKAPAPAGPAE